MPDVPVRAGEPADRAFIVEMARLASAVEGRPLPPADDPGLAQGLPPSPDASVLALDDDGRPVGAAWWNFRSPPLLVAPDGTPVPELADRAAEQGHDQLALNVHLRNPAARLYSPAGFVVAGKGRGPLGVAMVVQLPAGA